MHKHPQGNSRKLQHCSNSTATLHKRDPSSPHRQHIHRITAHKLHSCSKIQSIQRIPHFHTRKPCDGYEIRIITSPKVDKPEIGQQSQKNHISTSQSNEQLETCFGGKQNSRKRQMEAKTAKLEGLQEHKKQFRLITKLKQLRKPKQQKQKGETEPAISAQEPKETSTFQQKPQSFMKNDENRSEHELSSIMASSHSNFTDMDSCISTNSCQAFNSWSLTQSSLALESKVEPCKKMKRSAVVDKVNEFSSWTSEQINKHLQIIEEIYVFLQESLSYHEDSQEWKELHFLLLKKYYLERRKVVHFLKKYPMKNPFLISSCKLSLKEVLAFLQGSEGHDLLVQLELENKQIAAELSQRYEQFDKSRVGQRINLFLYDNLSQWMMEELWAQFVLAEYNSDLERDVLGQRLCRTLQMIFLISEINGRCFIDFESALAAMETRSYWEYISTGKKLFQQEIQYR